jgi:hypothetical protein
MHMRRPTTTLLLWLLLSWVLVTPQRATRAQPSDGPTAPRPTQHESSATHTRARPAPGLGSEFVFEAHVAVGPPQTVGISSHGLRRIVPILGGTVKGPRLSGQVLAGGADHQFVRPDGVLEIEARYTLQADDGTLIMITNRGLRRGPKQVIDKLARGEPVDPASYYFRTVAEFEAPTTGKHAWLNASIFVGVAERQAKAAVIRFFEVK